MNGENAGMDAAVSEIVCGPAVTLSAHAQADRRHLHH
jgi:hypothetical protein